MSEGFFKTTKYKSNGDAIWPIRVQPETEALQIGTGDAGKNTPPTENISGDVPTVYVGGSRRRYGIHARGVRVQFTETPPDGYDSDGVIFLPILRPELYSSIGKGATGVYLGKNIKVIGKVSEVIR